MTATVGPETKAFLYELYTRTEGNPETQVSMYEVGQALGLEKDEAGTLAESLYIQGLAELKTLSGGIGITREGLAALEINIDPGPDPSLSLGTAPVLEDRGRAALDTLLPEIKKTLGAARMSYPRMAELLMDIKTIEVQMLSPAPKTAIIREILKSIQANLESSGSKVDYLSNFLH
nr:hypothetical protein [Desulfobacula sp.]